MLDPQLKSQLAAYLQRITQPVEITAVLDDTKWKDVGPGPGSVHGKYVKWHTISDLEGSVVEDVQRIRSHPLVPGSIPIYGYIYDVKTGKLLEVKKATEAGKAR